MSRAAKPAAPAKAHARGNGTLREGPVLITGGAGFIGTNLAHRLASEGRPVIVYDDLSRAGVERNLAWLQERHPRLVRAEIADIRDVAALRRAVAAATQVFHFAAQVAVTTSLAEPAADFAINAQGTFNLLEAIRRSEDPPPLVFTSTNKVYGGLEDLAVAARGKRYAFAPGTACPEGIDETRPLSFHSPYGCSKGTADQYVADYARSYGLKTVVFRMSCIYGPHQCGTEDQGWVAHFLLCALANETITLYGDGRQVRDLLYVEDLVDAFCRAERDIDALAGSVFNVGGGRANAISLIELLEHIAELTGGAPAVRFDDWRQGDQRIYVSDHGAFTRATGWRPKVAVEEGVARLHSWLKDDRKRVTRRLASHDPMPAMIDVSEAV